MIQNWSVSSTKERDSYLFHSTKLDMEMTPDSLEVGGVNELLVAVDVDESFTIFCTTGRKLPRLQNE